LGGSDRSLTSWPVTLVVDASVGLAASGAPAGFDLFEDEELVAPALMWSEARSALHELLWRGEITEQDAEATRSRLERCPVDRRTHAGLGERAWRIATEMGWAKTYDAEYVALAQLLKTRVVTLDARLRTGAERLGCVIGPNEL
jgi:predicted nucleic acid-binding protein